MWKAKIINEQYLKFPKFKKASFFFLFSKYARNTQFYKREK